jgi:hypothetical protein
VAVSQRRALGALFLLLAVFFTGVAVSAFSSEDRTVWVVGVAAAGLALWLAGLALRGLWHRAR